MDAKTFAVLLDRSRIYHAGIDEAYYQSNLLFDQMRALAVGARSAGNDAKDDIALALKATKPADVAFYAFFAGVSARKAFSWASLVLDLDVKRQAAGLNDKPLDPRNL